MTRLMHAMALGLVALCGKSMAEPISIDWLGMVISDREKAAIREAMEHGRAISAIAETHNGRPYRRDAHAKATGCVRADFSVNGDIPPPYRHSIFSEPGMTYQAWIRFSNGDMLVQSDGKPDARGMAIKVMGVKGEKIAPELTGAATQDFIMTNTPAFFNRDVFDYAEDMRYLAKLQRTRWFVSLFPPRLHPKLLYRAVQTVSKKINTPLQPQYYSMLPYRLGETALKYSTRACSGMRFDEIAEVDKNDDNYLTEAMQKHLAHDAACFDFMVQPQNPAADMPLDDASVIWSETASPFVPIARVHIPPQQFTDPQQQALCENLSMNPWHGVGRWEPLGSLNRARRLVYNAVSTYRHARNDVKITQPAGWCPDGSSECDLSHVFNVHKATWPLPRIFDSQFIPLRDEETP